MAYSDDHNLQIILTIYAKFRTAPQISYRLPQQSMHAI